MEIEVDEINLKLSTLIRIIHWANLSLLQSERYLLWAEDKHKVFYQPKDGKDEEKLFKKLLIWIDERY